MHFGARLQAAIEVLTEIESRHVPAGDALREWGRAHRFAGSGDRAVIGNLVFDALRSRRSLAAWLCDDGPRAAVLGVAVRDWRRTVDEVAEACLAPHAPGELYANERQALEAPLLDQTGVEAGGDFPDWLVPEMQRAFGAQLATEARALCARPPIDLRINTLKSDRAKVLAALSRHGARETELSPVGVRIDAPPSDKRYPNVEAEAAHGKGWFEVQDEGSQIAAAMCAAEPGMQVLDMCAGAGGKTLALAAAMENKGQIHAYDSDKSRLRRIFPRLQRAGVRNCQVIDAGDTQRLAALDGRMDVVLVDAPCSGSGTWRRRPDAKWRLTPEALDRRLGEQQTVLAQAAPLVKPGGRLVYVTCSVVPRENDDQVAGLLKAQDGAFSSANGEEILAEENWKARFDTPVPSAGDGSHGLLLTPARTGTDGFYIAVLERAPASQ